MTKCLPEKLQLPADKMVDFADMVLAGKWSSWCESHLDTAQELDDHMELK